MREQKEIRRVILLFGVLLELTKFTAMAVTCPSEYEKQLCSMSSLRRREEKKAVLIKFDVATRMGQFNSELHDTYKALASQGSFALETKLMALMTATKNFPLRSSYPFEHLQYPIDFHTALARLSEKEYSALLAAEITFEEIETAMTSVRSSMVNFVKYSAKEEWKGYKDLFVEDSNFLVLQAGFLGSAEVDIASAKATFTEIKKSLEESRYAIVSFEVQNELQQLISSHANGFDRNIAILQKVQQWLTLCADLIGNITKDCEVERIRTASHRECTVRFAVIVRIMEVIINFSHDYDNVVESHLKPLYAITPLQIIEDLKEKSLETKETHIVKLSAQLRRSLEKRFGDKLEHEKQQASQLAQKASCFSKLNDPAKFETICLNFPKRK